MIVPMSIDLNSRNSREIVLQSDEEIIYRRKAPPPKKELHMISEYPGHETANKHKNTQSLYFLDISSFNINKRDINRSKSVELNLKELNKNEGKKINKISKFRNKKSIFSSLIYYHRELS